MRASPELLRKIPDRQVILGILKQDTNQVLNKAFPAQYGGPAMSGELSTEGLEALGMVGTMPDKPQFDPTPAEVLETGQRALEKLSTHGEDADFEPQETFALEAIVEIFGRPALLIQDNQFEAPLFPWEILDVERQGIQQNLPSIGRIEIVGHPRYQWIGTGFLVSDNVIMTNRHVALEFCERRSPKRWRFQPRMYPSVDYVEEHGSQRTLEFELTSVIGIHDTHDLALLRVARESFEKQPLPKPLVISSKMPQLAPGKQVYVVGYPALDSRNDFNVMQRIFHNIYNVKRLLPGEIIEIRPQEALILHDCTTMAGVSGASVIDLETHQVIGLHFGGRYREANSAVALWELTDDPLIKKGKVNYL